MNWEHEKQFVDNESFVSLRIDEFQILGLLTQRNNWIFDNAIMQGDQTIAIEESSDEQLKKQQLQKEQELYQVQQQLKQQLQKERELTRQLHEAQQQTSELYQAQEQQVRELYQLQQQQLNK